MTRRDRCVNTRERSVQVEGTAGTKVGRNKLGPVPSIQCGWNGEGREQRETETEGESRALVAGKSPGSFRQWSNMT